MQPAVLRQRGAAILAAMLTVVVVAAIAAAALWQQWRAVEVERAERARLQAAWVLLGAQDWARLILREDARKGGADHLAEPWAVPLAQARLSTFLAAEKGVANDDPALDAFLSGDIVDMQSRLNVINLAQGGKVIESRVSAFAKLFKLLNLPLSELDLLAQGIAHAQADGGTSAPLWPQELEQLGWFGLSPQTLERLRPFVAILPQPTQINLNTAPAEVIYATQAELEMSDAKRVVTGRANAPISTLGGTGKIVNGREIPFSDVLFSVSSRFFLVRGSLELDSMAVQERSLVQRDGLDVHTLWRRRGILPTDAPVQ